MNRPIIRLWGMENIGLIIEYQTGTSIQIKLEDMLVYNLKWKGFWFRLKI
ncbi:hypothetical protein LEP1GSC024_3845 [Leptospira noguchii str. 2001034031]|uniref:Uncharacterized protein n=1 Tax=Leptospira noguchii str. 2001034031 TaxID=1193053 RepID=M6YAC2_9LEPT|nr:hypothetical protein LEP1GSC024_3845 [Leptospira noguchii str. 2001034031]